MKRILLLLALSSVLALSSCREKTPEEKLKDAVENVFDEVESR